MLTINDKPARWLKPAEGIQASDYIYEARITIDCPSGQMPPREEMEKITRRLKQTPTMFHPVDPKWAGLTVAETAHGLCAAASIARYK